MNHYRFRIRTIGVDPRRVAGRGIWKWMILACIIAATPLKGTCGLTISATVTNISYEYFGFYPTGLNSWAYSLYYNGIVNITVTGGTAPYTYRVTPGLNAGTQPTGYFTGLGPGPRTYEITDANGLVKDTTFTLAYTYPQPSVTVTNINPPSTCTSADGSFTLNGSGGTPPYTYSIDGGTTFTTNNVFTNLSSGNYSFVLVKDANGQLDYTAVGNYNYDESDFSGPCPFSILSNLVAASCSGNTASLSVGNDGGTPPIQYSADGVNYYPGTKTYYSVTLSQIDSQYLYTFTNLPAGTFHAYAKDSTGQVTEFTAAVLHICPFQATGTPSPADCHQSNGSVTVTPINGTPPYLYSTDGTTFQTSNVFSGLPSGFYSFLVKDANNLVAYTYNLQVTDNCPAVNLLETDAACGQNNGTITATGYNGLPPYQFSINGNPLQASNIFNNLAPGLYRVTIQDANGNTGSAFTIINNNCLQLTLTPTGSTCGYKNGSITAGAFNGTGPYQYSKDGITFQSGTLFDSLAPGNYTITAKDATGLTTTALTVVTTAPGPVISPTLTPASCTNTNGSIFINPTGGTTPLQFSVNGGSSVQNTGLFTGLDSGQYIAWASDANGCTISDTIHLSALPTPAFSLGNDTILCTGDSLLLKAPDSSTWQYLWQDGSQGFSYMVKTQGVFSVTVTNHYGCSNSSTISIDLNPLPPVSLGDDTALCTGQTLTLKPVLPAQGTYLWSDGSTGSSLPVSGPGLYWIQLTDYGCRNRDSITVTYKPAPSLSLGNDTTLCAGQTLLLNATNNNALYQWQDGSIQPVYNVSGPGTYSVKVDENGCDTSGTITVSYTTKPLITLGNDTVLCTGERLSLDATYPQSTYLWQDGTTQPVYTISVGGTYTVDVTNACGDTKDSVIIAYQNCACQFHVPTAFSPNGDGVNDLFLPKDYCPYSNFELKVFDRWGKIVFDTRNADIGWNGDAGSQPQPSGTYVWELVYKDGVTGNVVMKKGTVVLIR